MWDIFLVVTSVYAGIGLFVLGRVAVFLIGEERRMRNVE